MQTGKHVHCSLDEPGLSVVARSHVWVYCAVHWKERFNSTWHFKLICLFKEHIDECKKYEVECPAACGVVFPREKVRFYFSQDRCEGSLGGSSRRANLNLVIEGYLM